MPHDDEKEEKQGRALQMYVVVVVVVVVVQFNSIQFNSKSLGYAPRQRT